MRASAVQIKVEAPDSADARFCLEGYFRELAERFETGFDPAKSISANVDELTPPAGVFVFARLGGQPIGCGALKVKDRHIGEIKRMWVCTGARGLGVGRRILGTLWRDVRLGRSFMRLPSFVWQSASDRHASASQIALEWCSVTVPPLPLATLVLHPTLRRAWPTHLSR